MDYEINFNTQTILPLSNGGTKIMENGSPYIMDCNPINVIEHSCEYFGSSYEGRKSGTEKLLGITHKSPIIVEESNRLIIFPTKSPTRSDCIWINLSQVNKYYSVNNHRSAVKFKNGDELELDISIGSLTNQIMRASRLKFVLDERLKKEDNS